MEKTEIGTHFFYKRSAAGPDALHVEARDISKIAAFQNSEELSFVEVTFLGNQASKP
ncbi:hypothetical protein [Lacibacter luteus]|uniref:hypothetical protein n=1 Tax=Lacibacter luteus TaxID=2508719 RepID=UPI0013E95720|nr:hypothetical protein [Lacibacter luteus]